LKEGISSLSAKRESQEEAYKKTLVYKYPDLCQKLLESSTIGVTSKTVQKDIKRMKLEAILTKPCDFVFPPRKLWTKKDAQEKGKDVQVEAFITGFRNFISKDGSFATIVKSNHAGIFETKAMKRAIEYKWETYGFIIHSFYFFIYIVMMLLFLASITADIYRKMYKEENDSSISEVEIMLGVSSLVSLITLRKEWKELINDPYNYLTSGGNVLDVFIVVLLWALTIWVFYDVTLEGGLLNVGSPVAELIKRAAIAMEVFLMSINFLVYLSNYPFIGATISMVYQMGLNSSQILIVMVVGGVAYVFVLQVILLGTGVEEEGEDTSPFEALGLHWSKIWGYCNLAFRLGFLGDFETSELESTQVDRDLDGHSTLGDGLNFLSWIYFVIYGIISNVILLNLLIAVMSDSYDEIKESEKVEQRRKRAKTLCDIDRVWGSFLSREPFRDLCYPTHLHWLTQKGDQGQDLDKEWEGKVKELRQKIDKNSQNLEKSIKGEFEDQFKLYQERINQSIERRERSTNKRIDRLLHDNASLVEMRGDIESLSEKLEMIYNMLEGLRQHCEALSSSGVTPNVKAKGIFSPIPFGGPPAHHLRLDPLEDGFSANKPVEDEGSDIAHDPSSSNRKKKISKGKS